MCFAGSSLPSRRPDRPPASALLRRAPSRLLGVPFALVGEAGSGGAGWQGGTLAVTGKGVSGSELETVSALKEITALSLGCVVWRGEGGGWKSRPLPQQDLWHASRWRLLVWRLLA